MNHGPQTAPLIKPPNTPTSSLRSGLHDRTALSLVARFEPLSLVRLHRRGPRLVVRHHGPAAVHAGPHSGDARDPRHSGWTAEQGSRLRVRGLCDVDLPDGLGARWAR